MTVTSLPTLRRKILRSFFGVIILYAILGVFLVISVFIASGTSPQLIHRNYDSVIASRDMAVAWKALKNPENYPGTTPQLWTDRFEGALKKEENNITEPGEKETTQKVRALWEQYRKGSGKMELPLFSELIVNLDKILAINETAMFQLAESNQSMSERVLWGAIIYFFLSLILSALVADGLAARLSDPLKRIAEALHRRPAFGKKLKLIEPKSLEMLILSDELKRLWDRVSESDKVNFQEVVQQKSRLEAVLESVEDALLVIDRAGVVIQCNSCLLDLVGLPFSEVNGRVWGDLDTGADNYLKLRSILSENMSDAQEIELQLRGTKHQFSARFKKISASPTSQITGVLFLLHDITEKRQREKFRAEFIDLLSHELKTPLQSLGTATELLKSDREKLPENSRLMVDTITEDVERIRAVANEFVQVTQSHSKILKLKMESIALNTTLAEWLKPFSVIAKDRKVQLNYVQEGSPVIWGGIDSVKFPWVVSNLLSNAIRFSPPGSKVDVVLTDRNGFVEIQVNDEGPGISEEDQARIFEPFFQSPMTTSSGMKGLFGIGLTIAKEVVEAHDGRIEYHRRQPRGSQFRILLPFPVANYN
jgi:PAS domain S-box-containing protein